MADKISAFWNHFLHHATIDMLTVLAVGSIVADDLRGRSQGVGDNPPRDFR
jgi:hypothetical protein